LDFTKEDFLTCLKNGERHFEQYSEEQKKCGRENPDLKKMREDLFAFAQAEKDKYVVAPTFTDFIRFDTDGDRDAFEYGEVSGYFLPRHRMTAFFLMVWLFEKEEYLQPLINTMWAILNEYSWALPAHMYGKSLTRLETDGYTVDLFAAQTAGDLAEVVYILGDKLPYILKARVKHCIQERIFDAVYAEGVRDFWWKRTKCNWAAVCAGSIGMAAMYLEDDDEKLCDLVYPLFDTMKWFLRGYTDDGVCAEGMDYWMYGFGYYMFFADVLKRRTAGAVDLFDDEKVKKISAFPASCLFGRGLCLPFSDSDGVIHLRRSMVNYIAERYPDLPKIEDDAINHNFCARGAERFPDAVRNFLWSNVSFPKEMNIKGTCYPYAAASWYIATSESGTTVMAKMGNNDESHNHDDVGQFAVCKNGTPLFWDSGCGNYSKQYFGKERYEYVECSSRGHSVPMIDNQLQKHGKKKVDDKDVAYAARDVKVTENGIFGDIAPVYDLPYCEKILRDLHFDRQNGVVTLQDAYSFTKEKTVVKERFVSVSEPKIEGSVAVLEKDGVGVTLSDNLGTVPTVSRERRVSVWGQEPDGSYVYFTDFEYEAARDFAVTFTVEEKTV